MVDGPVLKQLVVQSRAQERLPPGEVLAALVEKSLVLIMGVDRRDAGFLDDIATWVMGGRRSLRGFI